MNNRVKSRKNAFSMVCDYLALDAKYTLNDVNAPEISKFDPVWTDFIDIATDYLVAPAVGYQINRKHLKSTISPVTERYFRAALKLNRNRNKQIRKEALLVAKLLNEIDVMPMFLKGGAGLLSGLYDDQGIRVMSDLDILVSDNCSEKSTRHLEAAGFLRSPTVPRPLDKSIGNFHRQSSLAAIDLHREALSNPNQKLLTANEAITKADLHNVDGISFSVPNATHKALFEVGSSQLNDHGYWFGQVPLRSLHDFDLLMNKHRSEIDWDEIQFQFSKINKQTALDFYCLAGQKTLAIETPIGNKPNASSRVLIGFTQFLVGRSSSQRMYYRIMHVILHLLQELSNSELRARLFHNMTEPNWWRRHFINFLNARRG